MRWNLVGAFVRNNPFGTEIAFRKGLERIGETVHVLDPSIHGQVYDMDADVTVVFKYLETGIYREMLRQVGGKKIIYQVDDLRFPHIKQMMVEMRQLCSHALTFDTSGAGLARDYGYKSAQRLLLTADNQLYRHIPGMQKDIDVCFIGSMTNGQNHTSRMKMVQMVSQMPQIKFVKANEIFDIGKICELYNRSKVILNHATDVGQPFGTGYGYQCRHFEAGFTKSVVLSNKIVNDTTLQFIPQFSDEESFVEYLNRLLQDKELRTFVSEKFYEELYSAHLPEHRAKEMVEFVEKIK